MPGELGMSPEVSEEMEEDGEAGGISSWKVVETGVLRSQDAMPVRRRLEGGIFEAEGEKPCFNSSRSDISSEAMEERGEPGDSVIGRERGRNGRGEISEVNYSTGTNTGWFCDGTKHPSVNGGVTGWGEYTARAARDEAIAVKIPPTTFSSLLSFLPSFSPFSSSFFLSRQTTLPVVGQSSGIEMTFPVDYYHD